MPQIIRFLLSPISFSLPADFINLATPQTKTKNATAPKRGIKASPMFVKVLLFLLNLLALFYFNCSIVLPMASDKILAPKSMAAPITA